MKKSTTLKKSTTPKKSKPARNIANILKNIKRTPELENTIKEEAYFLAEKGHNIDLLNWMYAENQLKILKGIPTISKTDITKKAKEVSKQSISNEELCWKISELKVLIEKDLIKI